MAPKTVSNPAMEVACDLNEGSNAKHLVCTLKPRDNKINLGRLHNPLQTNSNRQIYTLTYNGKHIVRSVTSVTACY